MACERAKASPVRCEVLTWLQLGCMHRRATIRQVIAVIGGLHIQVAIAANEYGLHSGWRLRGLGAGALLAMYLRSAT